VSRRPERYDAPLVWLRANKHELGALTGQDTRALLAIAYCWRLWGGGDTDGRNAAIAAVRSLLHGMQEKTRYLAREVIPWALDWSHRDQLWPLVTG
jgi:hypothetical protein